MNLSLVTILGDNSVDIETEDEEVVATFKIDRDEHGWRWWLIYADKTKAARVGRL